MIGHPFLLIITTVFFILNLSSCAILKRIDEIAEQRVEKEKEQRDIADKRFQEWGKKYLGNVLYMGMPEEEFARLFTKTSSWTVLQRPYVTKQIGNKYILSGLESSYDYRVTFENGRLIKFEKHGHEGGTNPFGYYDCTFQLKGYNVNGPGFYSGMPEEEFLQNFTASILSQSGNCYVVIGKNSRKYKVTFKNGYLVGMKSLSR